MKKGSGSFAGGTLVCDAQTLAQVGERLLREMDSFDFIEAWDAAVKERQTVPSVTIQMLIADAVTAHLTTAMLKKNAA